MRLLCIFRRVLHLAQDMPATLPGSVHHSVGPEVGMWCGRSVCRPPAAPAQTEALPGGQSWALPDYAGSRSLVMKASPLYA